MRKKITIIISCFNNESFLNQCLKSVFNQSVSYRYYDVVFIDDKSTDKSLNIAKKFLIFKNFKIIKNSKNIGLVKSLNKALKNIKSEFIVRIDADDYVSNIFIKSFLTEIKKGYEFIYSDYSIFTNKKHKNCKFIKFKINKLISCSVALKLSILKKINLYRNFMWEEYDLYLRYLAISFKIKRINKILYFYRMHTMNMTKAKGWKLKAWKELFQHHNKKIIREFELKANKF